MDCAARTSSAPLTQALAYPPHLEAMLVLRRAGIATRGGVRPDVAEDAVQGPPEKRRAGAASRTQSAGKANSAPTPSVEAFRGGALPKSRGGARRWTAAEERKLLAAIARKGIAVQEGGKLPTTRSLEVFAFTIAPLFSELRGSRSIAHKIRKLLARGETALSLLPGSPARPGTGALLGVSFNKDKKMSPPRTAPPPPPSSFP